MYSTAVRMKIRASYKRGQVSRRPRLGSRSDRLEGRAKERLSPPPPTPVMHFSQKPVMPTGPGWPLPLPIPHHNGPERAGLAPPTARFPPSIHSRQPGPRSFPTKGRSRPYLRYSHMELLLGCILCPLQGLLQCNWFAIAHFEPPEGEQDCKSHRFLYIHRTLKT